MVVIVVEPMAVVPRKGCIKYAVVVTCEISGMAK